MSHPSLLESSFDSPCHRHERALDKRANRLTFHQWGIPIHLVRQTLGHSSITEKDFLARPDDSSALYLED